MAGIDAFADDLEVIVDLEGRVELLGPITIPEVGLESGLFSIASVVEPLIGIPRIAMLLVDESLMLIAVVDMPTEGSPVADMLVLMVVVDGESIPSPVPA